MGRRNRRPLVPPISEADRDRQRLADIAANDAVEGDLTTALDAAVEAFVRGRRGGVTRTGVIQGMAAGFATSARNNPGGVASLLTVAVALLAEARMTLEGLDNE